MLTSLETSPQKLRSCGVSNIKSPTIIRNLYKCLFSQIRQTVSALFSFCFTAPFMCHCIDISILIPLDLQKKKETDCSMKSHLFKRQLSLITCRMNFLSQIFILPPLYAIFVTDFQIKLHCSFEWMNLTAQFR